MTTTTSRSALKAMFNARSVAFIGASERSGFSAISYDLVRRFGATGRTHLINPNSPEVFGVATYSRCTEVPGGVDCAYVMVPRDRVPGAIRDAAAAGARSAVVLTAGYAETGAAGASAQHELVKLCHDLDITLLGPNILGFVNVAAKAAVCALPGVPTTSGSVALVSQSGAGAGALTRFVASHGIRLSYAVTTGNEAMVYAEDVIDYLLDDENTRAIAIFAESFRRPVAFKAVAQKAAEMSKALVVLKVGASELCARTASAHTGAIVGDDHIIDAILRSHGVIRVAHMEELLHAANVAAHTGPWDSAGIGVASLSGGACDVIADRAEELNLSLPEFGESTRHRLSAIVSDLGHVQNPLDVTGAALDDPLLLAQATEALAADPTVGFVAVVGGRPTPAPMAVLAEALSAAATPGGYVATVSSALDEDTDAALQAAQLLYIPSIRDAVTALAKVSWWTTRLDQLRQEPQPKTPSTPFESVIIGERMSEVDVRELLTRCSIPVVEAHFANTAAEACAAAADFGGPVAMKAVSADITHKTDVGCVRLGVSGDASVAEAFDSIMSASAAITPPPIVDGVLVTPMRTEGLEFFAGVTHDSDWGCIMAVGLGGLFVEALGDTVLLPLPTRTADIHRALNGLRAAPLLRGARGRPPADLKRLTEVLEAVADLALSLGPTLDVLEINPLYVHGDIVEALDGLITWKSAERGPGMPV